MYRCYDANRHVAHGTNEGGVMDKLKAWWNSLMSKLRGGTTKR